MLPRPSPQVDVADAPPDFDRTLRQALQQLSLIAVALDRAGVVTSCNRFLLDLTGWTEAEVIGSNWFARFIPPNEAAQPMFLAAAQGGGLPVTYENDILTKAGVRRRIRWTNALLRDDAGRVSGTYSIGEDVTERLAIDEALRLSELRNRALVEHAPEAIVVLGLEHGRFLAVNSRAEQLFGMDRETLLLHGPADLSPPLQPDGRSSRERAMEELQAAVRGEIPRFEWVHRNAAGKDILCEISLALLPSATETLVRGSITDITERKQLQERLMQTSKMESIGRLAGGLAHDFNNLLTVIMGHAEAAQSEVPADSPAREDLAVIREAAERASRLTAQLLAFARKQVIEPRVVALNQLIAGVERLLGRLLGEDIRIVTDLSPELWRVRVDPAQFEQVLINLAANARDAMPRGGRLTITTSNLSVAVPLALPQGEVPAGDYVILAVSDTGPGIDPGVEPRIFEPFFTTKELGHGTGLGLSTSLGIVQQSGGLIAVESKAESGTTFRVFLPRVTEPVDRSSGPSRGLPAGGTETILLVEDEDQVRRVAERALARQGYRVLAAASAEEALRLSRATTTPIQLLCTDVVMPGMSGRALADTIVRERPGMLVLYSSGYTNDALMQHGVDQPGVHFLQKPYTPALLAQSVRDALDG